MRLSLKNLNYLLLATVTFLAVSPATEKLLAYFSFIAFLILAVILHITKPTLLILSKRKYYDYLPMLSLLTWLYGLLRGYYGGYPVEAVISNFAGMIFYIFYYFVRMSRQRSIDILYFLSMLACGYLIVLLSAMTLNFSRMNLDQFSEIGLSSVRLGWSSSLSLALLLVGLGFSRLINLANRERASNKYLRSQVVALAFILLGTLSIALTASKGFILALSILVFLLALVKSIGGLSRLRVGLRAISFFVFILFIVLWWQEEIIYLVDIMIELETDVDSYRPMQAIELINDFTLFGHGLGADLSTGYSRDVLGYGFELTFHNIVHKFGMFAIFPFLILIVPIVFSAIGILRGRNVLLNIAAFSLMLYVIPGYGNPIIYAPMNVLLNCLALYFVAHPSHVNSNDLARERGRRKSR